MHDKLKNKSGNKDPRHIEAILDSFKIKRLEKKTIAERVKLERQKMGRRIKILTPNELLSRLPILLTQKTLEMIHAN